MPYVSMTFSRSSMHACFARLNSQVLMWNRFQSSFSVKIVPLSAFCTVLRSMTELRPKKWWWFTRCYKYKAMNRKIRTEHGVQVPQHLVAFMQAHLDLEGVETRNVKKKRKRLRNHVLPLGVCGCMDTFSRKVLFLYVCYLQFLFETETFPHIWEKMEGRKVIWNWNSSNSELAVG